MLRLRVLAVAWGCLVCASCGAHGLSLYSSPDTASRPYTAIDRMRATLREDSARTAPPSSQRGVWPAGIETPAASRTYAMAPVLAPFDAPSVAAAAPARSSQPDADDGLERFACTDGSVLDLSYSEDRRQATARWGAGAPIALTRAEDEAVPTFKSGAATFRRVGPRVSWSDGGGAEQVTVQAGDTLSKIALARYGSFDRVAAIVAANAELIADPNLIFPGQVLVLPGGGRETVERSCRRTGMVQPA
jgi:nucleoid-associated protein YgaU